MKLRALLIYLSPLLILLPLLWTFAPHCAWKLQHHALQKVTIEDIQWDDTPIEEAIADLNKKLAKSGSKVRLKLQPAHLKRSNQPQVGPAGFLFTYNFATISLRLRNVTAAEALHYFSELTQSGYYPTGPNQLCVDSMDLANWPLRAKCWGRGVARYQQVFSPDPTLGFGPAPSPHWYLLTDLTK